MEQIIDEYLKELTDLQLNKLPTKIVTEMADPNQDENEEWRIWNPVKSQVTDIEIEEFESRLGHKLPKSYIKFLKYKHFYELQISECSFCEHPLGIWRASLSEMIFNEYPRELLLDKGKIPFANWSDWGLLCFDTNNKHTNNEYPIVLWDHEMFDEFEPKYINFEAMINELNSDAKENAS